jgi:hypothetical protein
MKFKNPFKKEVVEDCFSVKEKESVKDKKINKDTLEFLLPLESSSSTIDRYGRYESRNGKPTSVWSYGDNDRIEVKYHEKGVLHRLDGPAQFLISRQYGEIYDYKYCRNGKLHREDGPAVYQDNSNDKSDNWWFKNEEYWNNGRLHREDGPAKIMVDKNGQSEEYYIKGRLHREDGPAKIMFYGDSQALWWYLDGRPHSFDGNPTYVQIWNDGSKFEEWTGHQWPAVSSNIHREDGPARITKNSSGKITSETYYVNGQLHREDGPAVITHTSDGITKKEYWIKGVQYVEKSEAEHTFDGKKLVKIPEIPSSYDPNSHEIKRLKEKVADLEKFVRLFSGDLNARGILNRNYYDHFETSVFPYDSMWRDIES